MKIPATFVNCFGSESSYKKRKKSKCDFLNPGAARCHVCDSSFVLERDKMADQEGS